MTNEHVDVPLAEWYSGLESYDIPEDIQTCEFMRLHYTDGFLYSIQYVRKAI